MPAGCMLQPLVLWKNSQVVLEKSPVQQQLLSHALQMQYPTWRQQMCWAIMQVEVTCTTLLCPISRQQQNLAALPLCAARSA
jgi:hypothetical protein